MPHSLSLLVAVLIGQAAGPPPSAGTPAEASAVFAQARAICARDQGRLWDRDLCGPILLVDWRTREGLANVADPEGLLRRGPEGVYSGLLPESAVLANTPVTVAGQRWTQLLWPLPDDPSERAVLLAHELFHRVQDDLGLARPDRGNRHLDTLDGRYLIQLEWRALRAALMAADAESRRRALEDAVLFREARFSAFPTAREDEAALQVNEGVAEYTGVRLGLETREARRAWAVRNLEVFSAAPTFIRSFAYASGAAHGLLLDDLSPDWKTRVRAGEAIDALLIESIDGRAGATRTLDGRVVVYDGDGRLRAAEEAREAQRQARQAQWRARLLDSPVLRLPLVGARYQFNPQTLQALDGVGTVYPTLTATDAWGVLTVEDGALVQPDERVLTVSARDIDTAGPGGAGWRLRLSPGWRLVPRDREGDYTVVAP